MVGDTYTCFLYHTPKCISQSAFSTQFWCPGFATAAETPSLDRLTLEGPGSRVPWSRETAATRESFRADYLPSPPLISDRNISPVFMRKRPICLSWSFGLRDRLLIWRIYQLRMSSHETGQWTPSCCYPSALPHLARLSQKGAYTFDWCPNFCG